MQNLNIESRAKLSNYEGWLFVLTLPGNPQNLKCNINFSEEVTSDVGIVVSIAAFQAVDPGSIPGHRKYFFEQTNTVKSMKKLIELMTKGESE